MSFEQAGTFANQVIANLARMIADKQAEATAAADKIGGPEHTKYLSAEHEAAAEQAQWLAGRQAAWERLRDSGFAT